MQCIDLSEFQKIDQDWEHLLRDDKDARRELHKRIAAAAKREVDSAIDRSAQASRSKAADMEKPHKKTTGSTNWTEIRAWQEARVGSRGGYAAISAVRTPGGNSGAGAVTNYLENGHRIRFGAPGRKRYRPRASTVRVSGFHFYHSAQSTVEAAAYLEAEKFAQDLADKLEGK